MHVYAHILHFCVFNFSSLLCTDEHILTVKISRSTVYEFEKWWSFSPDQVTIESMTLTQYYQKFQWLKADKPHNQGHFILLHRLKTLVEPLIHIRTLKKCCDLVARAEVQQT